MPKNQVHSTAAGRNAEGGMGPAPRLYQQAFELLSEQIRSGVLADGTTLTETAVADRFGVSRAPARQALAALQEAGLAIKADGRGYVVTNSDPSRQGRAPTRQASLKLVSESSWQRIYGQIESEIAARIAFGSWRVNEAELARSHGVSRTVARDVIGRLQQRGVVRKDERARWVAPALTPRSVGELYELRWLLEPAALVKAAGRLPPGLLDGMHAHLRDTIDHAERIDGPTLDRLENELHVTLLDHCGNETLMQAIRQPQSLLIAHSFLYRWTARLFDVEPFLDEHLEIVDRLLGGQVEAAGRSLEAHLRASGGRAIARIDVIAGGPQPEPSSYLERL